MKMRLSDFAEVHRINVRTAQIHIKENLNELFEHIERRGKQGTWIDDFAQEFLLKTIQLPSKEEVYMPTAREAILMEKLTNLGLQLAEAERRAGENAEAAGKVKLLEANDADQKAQISDLSVQIGSLKEKYQASEKTAQELSDELTDVKKELQAEKNRKLTFRERLFGRKIEE